MATVKVRDLSLAYRTAGDSAKPALILLHGWPHSSAIYQNVLEELAGDSYVLAFDLPGVGGSHGARIAGAVVGHTVIPGLEPWSKIIADPRIWHFAFHNTPRLPETLVTGRERPYFDFFFDFLAKDRHSLSEQLRNELTSAYQRPEALQAGFDWYRAFDKDAARNREPKRIDVPLLYLRGDADGRRIEDYVEGLRAAGVANLRSESDPEQR